LEPGFGDAVVVGPDGNYDGGISEERVQMLCEWGEEMGEVRELIDGGLEEWYW
jgi:hypothetical protein